MHNVVAMTKRSIKSPLIHRESRLVISDDKPF